MSWFDKLLRKNGTVRPQRAVGRAQAYQQIQMPPQKPPLKAKDGRELVHIPAGEFLMGADCQVVYVDGFYIAKYPVTNAEYYIFWKEMLGRDPDFKPPAHWGNGMYPSELAEHPVVNVNWHEAMLYARWAGCRLPTEAEWEKAARGVDGRQYPWGNESDPTKCNVREAGIGGTANVNRYPGGASPYNVRDMVGNVWEWQADNVVNQKIIRGGSWFGTAEEAKCISRDLVYSGLRDIYVGFRLAH